MDFRKIIKFGKSSFIISLPKEWINKSKLGKGDLLYIKEIGDSLLLMPRVKTERRELKSTEIDISNLDERFIQRRIISAYIQNYNMINIYGRKFPQKSKFIKQAIQNLMALEIMEETSERIVAKDFLKMEEISLIDLVKRLDIISRAMYLDTLKVFEEDLVESIYERDYDVNRLTFLAYRVIHYNLQNSNLAKKNLSNVELVKLNSVVSNLERIADDAKRIAKLLVRVKLSKQKQENLLLILKGIYKFYEKTMKAYYKDNKELAFSLTDIKIKLIKDIRLYYDGVWNVMWASLIIEKMKSTISSCHSICRVIYN